MLCVEDCSCCVWCVLRTACVCCQALDALSPLPLAELTGADVTCLALGHSGGAVATAGGEVGPHFTSRNVTRDVSWLSALISTSRHVTSRLIRSQRRAVTEATQAFAGRGDVGAGRGEVDTERGREALVGGSTEVMVRLGDNCR